MPRAHAQTPGGCGGCGGCVRSARTAKWSLAPTPRSGRAVTTQEFVFYRVEGGRIVEVWVAADDAELLDPHR